LLAAVAGVLLSAGAPLLESGADQLHATGAASPPRHTLGQASPLGATPIRGQFLPGLVLLGFRPGVFSFSGRIGGRKLVPERYHLRAVPPYSGRTGVGQIVTFRIAH
jgi:hypothetical protein